MYEIFRRLNHDSISSLRVLNSLLQDRQPLLSCLLLSCAKPELSVAPLYMDADSDEYENFLLERIRVHLGDGGFDYLEVQDALGLSICLIFIVRELSILENKVALLDLLTGII